MDAGVLALLAGAAAVAGGVNSVAGGGSLVLFPALLAAGLPTLPANVTNSTALWPGYVGTVLGYRTELARDRTAALALSATSLVGGAVGAVLLLTTGQAVFDAVVPFLVLGAGLLLAVQPRVAAAARRMPGSGGGVRSPLLHGGVLLAGVYGGYFGGALGVLLLAVLAVLLPRDLQQVNAVRSAVSLAVNTVALVVFALFGPVRWTVVAVCAPAALLGGYVGARLARLLPAAVLRACVVGLALVVGVVLLVR